MNEVLEGNTFGSRQKVGEKEKYTLKSDKDISTTATTLSKILDKSPGIDQIKGVAIELLSFYDAFRNKEGEGLGTHAYLDKLILHTDGILSLKQSRNPFTRSKRKLEQSKAIDSLKDQLSLLTDGLHTMNDTQKKIQLLEKVVDKHVTSPVPSVRTTDQFGYHADLSDNNSILNKIKQYSDVLNKPAVSKDEISAIAKELNKLHRSVASELVGLDFDAAPLNQMMNYNNNIDSKNPIEATKALKEQVSLYTTTQEVPGLHELPQNIKDMRSQNQELEMDGSSKDTVRTSLQKLNKVVGVVISNFKSVDYEKSIEHKAEVAPGHVATGRVEGLGSSSKSIEASVRTFPSTVTHHVDLSAFRKVQKTKYAINQEGAPLKTTAPISEYVNLQKFQEEYLAKQQPIHGPIPNQEGVEIVSSSTPTTSRPAPSKRTPVITEEELDNILSGLEGVKPSSGRKVPLPPEKPQTPSGRQK